jgi:uncharacterized membrane protein
MEGVTEVRQLDDTHLHWYEEFAGRKRHWRAEITERIPDRRVAWRNTSGAPHAGVVTFMKLDDAHTRIMLKLDYDPRTIDGNDGAAREIMARRIEDDLERFKELLEARAPLGGAWYGGMPADRPSARH